MTELEPTPDIFARVRRLEVGMEVQAEILTNIQQMLLEADRLTDSIGRLGEGAGSLSAALLQVDAQQKILTRLGEDIKKVETTSVTKDELHQVEDQRSREALEFRKQILQRIFTTTMVLLTLLGIAGLVAFGYIQSQQDATKVVCQARAEQNLIIIDVLEQTIARDPDDPTNDLFREDIERLRALNSSCEGL